METIKKNSSKAVFLAVIALVCSWAVFSDAGNLNPSAPPAPTMKTLDEVEARIPVQSQPNSPGALYLISQSGSYYLTGNISGQVDKHAIQIDANNVTVDLNGYSLMGPGKAAGSTGHGVYAPSSYSNITVCNGNSSDWREKGVYLSGESSRVLNIDALNNGQAGIEVGRASIVRNCTSRSNGYDGIDVGEHSIVCQCVARSNSNTGIYSSAGSSITGCIATLNYEGIECSRNCSVTDCSSSHNRDVGIDASNGSTIANCSAVENDYHGIEVAGGSVVSNCSCRDNTEAGIAGWHSLIIGNATYNNNPNIDDGGTSTKLHNHEGP